MAYVRSWIIGTLPNSPAIFLKPLHLALKAYSPTWLFFIFLFVCGCHTPKPITKTHVESFFSIFFSGLTVKFLIHFELIFNEWCKIWVQFHFFCLWLSSFPSTIYWKNCLIPREYSWLLHQISVDCIYMALFWAFYFTPLVYMSGFLFLFFVLASTILFWLL